MADFNKSAACGNYIIQGKNDVDNSANESGLGDQSSQGSRKELTIESSKLFRQNLIKNGFNIIRVPTGQKSPRDKNWIDGSSLNQLLNPSNEYLNTGLLCSGLRVIDVDVEDEKQAHEIEETAQRIIGSIGPKRYRDNSNKFAIVYRAKSGKPKKRLNGNRKVEVLGEGQQLIVDGLHPSNFPYVWLNDRSLENTSRDDVPVVTEEQISKFLEACDLILGCSLPDMPGVNNSNNYKNSSKFNLHELRSALLFAAKNKLLETHEEHLKYAVFPCAATAQDYPELLREIETIYHEASNLAGGNKSKNKSQFDYALKKERSDRRTVASLYYDMRSLGWFYNDYDGLNSQNDNQDEVIVVLQLDPTHTHANAKKIFDVLQPKIAMYYHGGQLKGVGVEELPPQPCMPNEQIMHNGGITSALSPISIDYLRAQASKHIKFVMNKRQNLFAVKTPISELREIIAAPKLFGALSLHQLLEAPFLTASGEIITSNGYHPNQGIYLSCNIDISKYVIQDPTRDDALNAANSFKEKIFGEFPFVDNASLSAALSMQLTLLVRNLMPNAPMHGVTAPTPGTGKSFLQTLTTLVAFNRELPASNPGKTDEEFEKRLVSAVIANHPVIGLDNVNGVLKGDMLCQILTQPTIICRPLGKSEQIKIVNRTTIIANGNNLQLPDDMVRRTILTVLDANTDRPEARLFNIDGAALKSNIIRERSIWLARGFTIIRAFLIALSRGEAELLQPLNGFEEWSAFVRSPLVWLGFADPVATQERVRSEDPERARRCAIFKAFAEITRDPVHDVIIASTIKDALLPIWSITPFDVGVFNGSHRLKPWVDILIENVPFCPGQRATIDTLTHRLSLYFRKNTNAVAAGFKLLNTGVDRNGTTQWKLERHSG